MKEMLGQVSTIFTHLEYVFLAGVFSVINMLIRPAKSSAALYFVEFFVSVAFATLIGVVCVGMGLQQYVSFLLVAASALLARDILTFVVGFGDYVVDNREAVYKRLFKFGMSKLHSSEGKKDE